MRRSAECVTLLWLVGGLITRWPSRNLNHQPPCSNHGMQHSLSITISQSLFKLMSISQWCHPTISSSVFPFSSCPQSLPVSVSFPMSWLFTSGAESIRELQLQPQSFQWLFRVDFLSDSLDLFSLQSRGLSRVFSSITIWKHQLFSTQPSL